MSNSKNKIRTVDTFLNADESEVSNEKKSQTKKLNTLDLIKENIGNEASQAFVKIFRSSSCIFKMFWFTCLMAACSLSAFFMIQSLITFVTYEVSTNTRTIFETASLFPRITYCNKNPFNTKYSFESLEKIGNYNDMLYAMNYVLNDSEKLSLQHPFDKVLVDCSFNNEKCTISDFLREFDPNLGNCFSFNSGFNASKHLVSLKESVRAGSTYGLKLTLYVNFYEYLTKYNQYTGAVIKIGNSSYSTINFGPEISPGYKTNLIVSRVFEESLPKPYSQCDIPNDAEYHISSDLYNRIRASEYEYTQQICYNACVHKKLLELCNCVRPNEQTFFPEAKVCSLKDACLKNFTSTLFNYRDKCFEWCPLQCNRSQYLTTLSVIPISIDFSSTVKSSFASDFITRPINFENARNSIARIYIFYDSLSYIKSVEQARSGSVLELAANIGGILGLFLGVSVLSFFEFIEVLIELCISHLKLNKST